MKLSNLRRFLTPVVTTVTLVFILKVFLAYSGDAIEALPLIPLNLIFFSALLYLGYFYLRALSWYFIVKSLKGKLKPKESFSVWFLGESTRYIPGNIWSFASRVYLGNLKGLPKSLTLMSLSIEALLLIGATFLLSVPVLFFNPMEIDLNKQFLVVFITLIFAGGGLIFFLKNNIKKTLKSLQKIPVTILTSSNFLKAAFFQLFSWVFFGIATFVLLANLVSSHSFFFISLIIFSWLLGYLSFITPMGLGIREGVMIALFTPFIGVGPSTLIALLSRLLMTLVDLLNIGAWFLLVQRNKLKELKEKIFIHWDLVVVITLILCYIFIFSTLSILRHNTFASNFDLANMDQTIWNSLHGSIFSMSDRGVNITRIATHSDFILILLAPLYLLWDNVRILLIFQSILLGVGALSVYLLSKKLLKNKLLWAALPFLYLLNPGLQWANIYDFHGVTLAIPFVLFAFFFGLTKNWKWYWAFFLLALITKEEISLMLAGMGFFFAVFQRQWKAGLLSFLIGMVWFPLMVFLIIPHFSPLGEHWAFNQWFSGTKENLDHSNILSLLESLRVNIFSVKSLNYYGLLLKPFSFLPLLGLPWILISAPEVFINIISSNPGMQYINMHYQSGIIPGIVIGMVFGCFYIEHIFARWFGGFRKFLTLAFPIALIIAGVQFAYWNSPLPITPWFQYQFFTPQKEDKDFEKVLSQIPQNASIAASGEVRSHLTHRVNAFNLPEYPKDVDYFALIDENRVLWNSAPHEFELELIKKLSTDPSYKEVFHEGHFYLFKKDL